MKPAHYDYGTVDEAKADAIARGNALTLVVWNGIGYEQRPVASRGFGGCLIGLRAEVDARVAEARAQGYRYGMVSYID